MASKEPQAWSRWDEALAEPAQTRWPAHHPARALGQRTGQRLFGAPDPSPAPLRSTHGEALPGMQASGHLSAVGRKANRADARKSDAAVSPNPKLQPSREPAVLPLSPQTKSWTQGLEWLSLLPCSSRQCSQEPRHGSNLDVRTMDKDSVAYTYSGV